MNKHFSSLIALIAGALLPFAFAPQHYFMLGILCPALFVYTWCHHTPKQAFQRGLLFGLGFFALGVWWVYISIRYYGHAVLPAAIIITIMFIFYLSLYPALQAYCLQKWVRSPSAKILLAYPASWVLFEWLRSHIITGFPWLLIGYSQLGWPLSGFAPIGGVWLVSFLVIFTSASLVAIRTLSKPVWISALILTTAIWISGAYFKTIDWSTPNQQQLTVSLIQGNIPQELKWQPDMVVSIIDAYLSLTKEHWNSDLIIWPEGAVTVGDHLAKNMLQQLDTAAKAHQTTVMLGIPIVEGRQYYNGMIAVGMFKGQYKKRRLVPFGEYLFLKPVSEYVMQYLDIPMSDFSAGPMQQTHLKYHHAAIATFICYETVYPELVRASLPEAQLFVALTDDSWFGESSAAAQHLQMNQMRALENGRYLLSATNTGITAFISPKGNVIASLPESQRDVLTHDVKMMHHNTPWSRWGEKPILFLMIVIVGGSLISARRP